MKVFIYLALRRDDIHMATKQVGTICVSVHRILGGYNIYKIEFRYIYLTKLPNNI